jgi:hypothetical protein
MDKRIQDFIDNEFKSELHLETFLTRKVKENGGWAIKFNSVGTNGLPDRIIFYSGFVWLVEVKWKKGAVRPLQIATHKQFQKNGFRVRIVRTKEDVNEFIQDMLNLAL